MNTNTTTDNMEKYKYKHKRKGKKHNSENVSDQEFIRCGIEYFARKHLDDLNTLKNKNLQKYN